MRHEEAIAIIAEGRGTHFDPDVADAFAEIADEFRDIAGRFADREQRAGGAGKARPSADPSKR
jgi:putative two-component system response regulator